MQLLKKMSMTVDFAGKCAHAVVRVDGKTIYDQKMDRKSSKGFQKILTAMSFAFELASDKTVGPILADVATQMGPIIQSALGTESAMSLQEAVEQAASRPSKPPRRPRRAKVTA
jgi:hypothetical protein